MFGTLSYALSWYSESSQVAKQEFGAKAALEKYEWFKDASAKLESSALYFRWANSSYFRPAFGY